METKKLSNFDEVITFIKQEMKYWQFYPSEQFARKEGDAYIVANEILERQPVVKSSQLRKFYNEAILGFNAMQSTSSSHNDVEYARTILAMLLPRIYYARSRNTINKAFLRFMEAALNLEKFHKDYSNFRQDYLQFIRFFEAVVGYHNYIETISPSSKQGQKKHKSRNKKTRR